jgi:CDP-diacylglycerol--serine O-phosphatidyltransferase
MIGFYNYTVILTYIGVASAVSGMWFAISGRTSMAIVCLMVSGFCDLFDGTIARTKKRNEQEKKFGIQIDSLADLVCFGVLPAVIGVSIGLKRWYEIAILIVYVLAALIRLAYYNVTEDELQLSVDVQRRYYDGLPVTSVALVLPLIYAVRPLMKNGFLLLYSFGMLSLAVAFLSKIKVYKPGVKGRIVAACCGAIILTCLLIGWNRLRVVHG